MRSSKWVNFNSKNNICLCVSEFESAKKGFSIKCYLHDPQGSMTIYQIWSISMNLVYLGDIVKILSIPLSVK